MPATYEPIASTTLGSGASTITFSSISSAFTDLRLVLVCTTSTSRHLYLRYNGDSGSNYSSTNLVGDGFNASSYRRTSVSAVELTEINTVGTSTTIPEFFTVDIFSYAGSTNKTCLVSVSQERNDSSSQVQRKVGLWRSTSAINEITLSLSNTGDFSAGTVATLFGIKAA